MAKKIVILNGSPRRNGNTSALVKKFTEGAESVGNTVTEFFAKKSRSFYVPLPLKLPL
ncbi:hypothetical protein AALA61_16430 [Oscillospiraceae bacterium 42-9]